MKVKDMVFIGYYMQGTSCVWIDLDDDQLGAPQEVWTRLMLANYNTQQRRSDIMVNDMLISSMGIQQ